MHKYLDTQGHIDTPDRQTDTHLCTEHLHTHPHPTLTCIPTSPRHRPGSAAAVAHALLPTPPRGRRCPRGNRGLRSLLKLCWLPRDINSSLAAAGSSELGARHRHFGPCWENREGFLSTVHPPAPTAASPSGLSAGCAGTWGRGGKGLAEGLPGPGQEGYGLQECGLWALAEARLCSVFGQLCGSPSQGSMGLGLPE